MLPVLRRRNEGPRTFLGLESDFDGLWTTALGLAPSMSGWTPAVDVAETAEAFTVTAELPGLSPDNVEISLEDGVMSISGEKRDTYESGAEGSGRHVVERRYGKFQRNFSLPRSVDSEKVQARFEDGLLVVTLPKAEAAKARRITIG